MKNLFIFRNIRHMYYFCWSCKVQSFQNGINKSMYTVVLYARTENKARISGTCAEYRLHNKNLRCLNLFFLGLVK